MEFRPANALADFWTIECMDCKSTFILRGIVILNKVEEGIICPGCGKKLTSEVLKSALNGMLALECSLFKIFNDDRFRISPPPVLHPTPDTPEHTYLEGQNRFWRCILQDASSDKDNS